MEPNAQGTDWNRVMGICGVLALVLSAIGLALTGWIYFEGKREEKRAVPANLQIPAAQQPPAPSDPIPFPEYLPAGPNLPTLISFPNTGKRQALVKQVVLSNYMLAPTPVRQKLIGDPEPVRVVFERRHFVASLRQFNLVFQKPVHVGSNEWVSMHVALVDPELHGQTFVGKVTLVYDGGDFKSFNDVQLDILKLVPK